MLRLRSTLRSPPDGEPSGFFYKANYHRPADVSQLRADLSDPRILAMTKGFGAIAVLHSNDRDRSLRSAATRAGIAAVTIEAGEPMRFQSDEVEEGVQDEGDGDGPHVRAPERNFFLGLLSG